MEYLIDPDLWGTWKCSVVLVKALDYWMRRSDNRVLYTATEKLKPERPCNVENCETIQIEVLLN